MNWTSIITTFVICSSFAGLVLSIVVKIISNKVHKQLPDCAAHFTRIQTEIKEMKQGSTERLKMTAALEVAMELTKEQYRELHAEFKAFSGEVKEIFVKLGEIGKDIKYMSNDINEMKKM